MAAGDVARWWHPLYERHLRIEHWDYAGRQGAAAARTLLAGADAAQEFDEVPYFWSDQYDVKVQMLGVPDDYDAIRIVEGDATGWEFVAAYGRSGRTIAVLGTIPGRVYAYRDAISKRAELPACASRLTRGQNSERGLADGVGDDVLVSCPGRFREVRTEHRDDGLFDEALELLRPNWRSRSGRSNTVARESSAAGRRHSVN